jgi:AcrR family transcriptional regulator
MARKGVDGTAIADITEEADVGFGSFYNHFKTKSEIAHAVFATHALHLRAIIQEIGDTEADRAVAIAYIFQLFLTKAIADPIWGSFVVQATSDLPGMWAEVFEELGERHLREGMQTGRFRISSERSAMRLIISAIIATMRAVLEGEAEPHAQENTVECILRMCGVQGDEPAELSHRPLPDYVATRFGV